MTAEQTCTAKEEQKNKRGEETHTVTTAKVANNSQPCRVIT